MREAGVKLQIPFPKRLTPPSGGCVFEGEGGIHEPSPAAALCLSVIPSFPFVIRPSPGGIVPTRLVICSPRLVIVSKRLVVVPPRLGVVSSRLASVSPPARLP